MLGDGGGLRKTSTVHPSPLAIDWASLGQSEFDLPGTLVSASRPQPHTHLVINLDTLGQSDIAMPGDEEVVTESAAMQGAGLRTSRMGQAVVDLDADCGTPLDLDSDPTSVGPGAEVGTHQSDGVMSGASLSTNSGRRQNSGQGPGGGAHGHPDRQPGDVHEYQLHPVPSVTAGGMSVGGRPPKKKKLQPSKACAARRLAPRGALKK